MSDLRSWLNQRSNLSQLGRREGATQPLRGANLLFEGFVIGTGKGWEVVEGGGGYRYGTM